MAGTLGSRLRAERKELGLTLGTLSKRCGVSPSMLSDLEHDRSRGSTRLHEIASALGLNPTWLATGEGPKKAKAGAGPVDPARIAQFPSPEGIRLGVEWEKLDEPLRTQIQIMIETLVAAQVKRARKKPIPRQRGDEARG